MKKKFLHFMIFCLLAFSLSGCYQTSSDGYDDLVTIPVTNNPNVLPGGGGAFDPPSGVPY